MWCCLCDPTFSRFSRTPTCDRETDRQTDGRTDGHRAMASTADAQHHAVKRKATVGRIYRTEKEGFKPGMKEWRGDESESMEAPKRWTKTSVALKHRLLSTKSGVLQFLTAHNKAICQIVAQCCHIYAVVARKIAQVSHRSYLFYLGNSKSDVNKHFLDFPHRRTWLVSSIWSAMFWSF